jgi:hypothetical protein
MSDKAMRNATITRAVLFLLVLFFAAPAAVIAQEAPPPLSEVWLITPKAGHGKEFHAGLAAHMAFRSEQGDPRAWRTYTPLLGEQLNRVAVRYCCFAWADADAYREWEDGKPEVQAHFDEHVAPHVESAAHYFETMDWANSHWSEAKGPYRLYAVTEFTVAPGQAGEFDAAREKMSQIAIEQGWASDDHVWLWATVIGGQARQSVIVPHQDFASFDRPGETLAQFLADRLGSAEAAAELMNRFQSATTGAEFQVWEHQAELSMPASD